MNWRPSSRTGCCGRWNLSLLAEKQRVHVTITEAYAPPPVEVNYRYPEMAWLAAHELSTPVNGLPWTATPFLATDRTPSRSGTSGPPERGVDLPLLVHVPEPNQPWPSICFNAKLEFSQFHRYEPGVDGIAMPVVLRSGGEAADLLAYLDTGANNCLLERRHGELLKLEIEAGDRSDFSVSDWRVDALSVISLSLKSSV